MKRSRLKFSRYYPLLRQQLRQRSRRQILLASSVGLSLLLISITILVLTDRKNPVGLTSWVVLLPQQIMGRRNPKDTTVLKLASQSPEERVAQLEAIAIGPKSLNRGRARYLLAVDAIAGQQGREALRWLDKLEWEYPVLAGHIVLKRAQAYQLTGDKAKAQEAWQELLQRYGNQPVAAEALYAFKSDDSPYRKPEKESIAPKYARTTLTSEQLWLAKIQQIYDFSAEEPKYWERALKNYPSHPRIIELIQQKLKDKPNQPELMLLLARYTFDQPGVTLVLDKLVSNYGKSVDEKNRAIIQPQDWEAIALAYWKDRKYAQASAAYANAKPIPKHTYLGARALQYAQKPKAAKLAYKKMVEEFPDGKETALAYLQLAELEPPIDKIPYFDQVIDRFPDRAAEALLAKAKTLEQLNSPNAAEQAYKLLIDKYSNSDAAADYRWQMAQEAAQNGDILTAWHKVQPILKDNPHSLIARRAGFWSGKWATQLGRKQEAEAAFKQVITNHIQSYYAWRSAVQLGWDVGDFTTLRQPSLTVNWPTVRPDLPVGSAALKELYQLGQDQDAWSLWQAEFQTRLKPTVPQQFTDGLFRLAMGEYLKGISLVETLEDRETSQEQEQYQKIRKKPAYWQALYPFPYIEVIETESKQRNINPLLVISLIRQESRFEANITSVAGAMGLMQMLPSTAAWVGKSINFNDYKLDNPNDNIKLGTWFLAHSHRVYEDNSAFAIASYNAGQGNVGKWLKGNEPIDLDEFVETIPFSETRNYVKQVLGNYWNYLRLYNPEVGQQLVDFFAQD
ncbi:transglycosylase SLT domain-containing protein [Moorena producens JHB]|uniref:Transglycosylase SLT domain-containing protein n=1 Tax=Moorena producens (strain JHB) TaxID=1454205 RepID=A0A1D9FWX2_MOOP1|nr:transglycosylase SLT domain-containing protein [Moorena producens]AOY79774.1 transglycosylase SLT domain-containing protein [Moorena producens JHB]